MVLVAGSGLGVICSNEGYYLLCIMWFANLSSVAVLLGGLGGMAPNRRKDVARLGMKAVLAGTL